ncbi:glycerol-3-phosphate 1-O-acyltransferase PlsY [Ferrimonas marina]|uniref:Glycerol-3-phosphate acyltransferase n=1 Tax=Ferrimonas marina TaxID=299255 RepID=A0A1M5X5P7_9GAMM|nr:glycerol-3-phosphate 1-O-acyltransferase PlsY [Ferrimonas marina]SHH94888.1 glycerol-3-phosphate acyltransferase PlsY [Ferrimonas marina]
MTLLVLSLCLVAYLLGSISSAVLVSRLFGLPDPRTQGSGNPGATNVLRLGGKGPAALVLLFDVLKGTLPVWGSYYLGLPPLALAAIGIAACLGHIYPIFFQFQGGKGVATALGAVAPIGFDMIGAVIATWVVVALISRYSSLASIVTALLAPLYAWLFKGQYAVAVALLCLLILWRHKGNMVRLWRGQEHRFGSKKKNAA